MKELIYHFGIENYDIDSERKLCDYFGLTDDSNLDQEDNIVHCSGGEMQKLELIRNFQKSCIVKIMDEPTNGLDSETVKRLVWLLEKEKKEHIFIIVSHDKRVLNICDEKIVIKE